MQVFFLFLSLSDELIIDSKWYLQIQSECQFEHMHGKLGWRGAFFSFLKWSVIEKVCAVSEGSKSKPGEERAAVIYLPPI